MNFESIDLKTTCGDLGNVRLHEGAARTEDWEARIDHVVFGDLTGDDLEEAVVVATCTTGGTAGPIPEYHVFGFVDDRLHPMAVIQGGSKMLDPDSVRIEQRTLVITRWFQDGNAMPLREQTETLRWNGKAFDRKKITARTQLDVGQER